MPRCLWLAEGVIWEITELGQLENTPQLLLSPSLSCPVEMWMWAQCGQHLFVSPSISGDYSVQLLRSTCLPGNRPNQKNMYKNIEDDEKVNIPNRRRNWQFCVKERSWIKTIFENALLLDKITNETTCLKSSCKIHGIAVFILIKKQAKFKTISTLLQNLIIRTDALGRGNVFVLWFQGSVDPLSMPQEYVRPVGESATA